MIVQKLISNKYCVCIVVIADRHFLPKMFVDILSMAIWTSLKITAVYDDRLEITKYKFYKFKNLHN
jgi:hypothetical protein